MRCATTAQTQLPLDENEPLPAHTIEVVVSVALGMRNARERWRAYAAVCDFNCGKQPCAKSEVV